MTHRIARGRTAATALGAMLLVACNGSPTPSTNEDAGAADAGPAIRFPSDRKAMSCQFDAQPLGVVPLLSVTFETNIEGVGRLKNAYTDQERAVILLLDTQNKVYRWRPTQPSAELAVELGVDTGEVLDLAVSDDGDLFTLTRVPSGVEVHRLQAEGESFSLDSKLLVLRASSQTGALEFDEQGFLLLALSDTTEDPLASVDARDPATREGVVSRIDIRTLDASGSYAIPDDNPSYGEVSETFALGARRPFACDRRKTGEVWCADRGRRVDELHRIDKRRDLGWPTYDGRACARSASCDLQLDLFPQHILEREGQSCGMSPGAFWHGESGTRTDDVYVYVDTCSANVYAMLTTSPDRTYWSGVAAEAPANMVGVFRDLEGRPLLLSADGQVYRTALRYTSAFPERLSETGCFEDTAKLRPAAAVVPYTVNAPLWTDGADKQRHFELPPGAKLTASPAQWEFPIGSVVLKTFSYRLAVDAPPTPVETRAMIRRPYGWEFHSYRWLEDASDALLLDSGDARDLAGYDSGKPQQIEHTFPSRNTCTTCHGREGAQTIGLRSDQLDGEYDYETRRENQLLALFDAGLVAEMPSAAPTMPNPYEAGGEEGADLEARARAYLHTNCAHCHRPGGWVPNDLTMDLRYDTQLVDADLCGVPALYGIGQQFRVSPGNPDDSRVLARMSRRDFEQMPPLATSIVDTEGVDVVRQWIASLDRCPD